MTWFKVDDGFHSSRKLLSIPKRHRLAAAGLWSIAGSWCADELTDGHVPDYMLTVWGATPALVNALTECGLWEPVEDGNVFYKWHEYQPSKRDVDAERAASRARMKAMRDRRRAQKPRNDAENGEVFDRTPSEQFGERSQPPTRPDPTTNRNTPSPAPPATPKTAAPPPGFDAFWAKYPRKVGKQAALKAYTKALHATTAETILQAVPDFRGTEKQFIPHPTTWLNEGRWDDEPTSTTSRNALWD